MRMLFVFFYRGVDKIEVTQALNKNEIQFATRIKTDSRDFANADLPSALFYEGSLTGGFYGCLFVWITDPKLKSVDCKSTLARI